MNNIFETRREFTILRKLECKSCKYYIKQQHFFFEDYSVVKIYGIEVNNHLPIYLHQYLKNKRIKD